ncbi:MAG: hypothetical protein GYA34_19055 [Chloroflexi bacterium]|nr:hypothetical protein [Chloroflexota bacterium]
MTASFTPISSETPDPQENTKFTRIIILILAMLLLAFLIYGILNGWFLQWLTLPPTTTPIPTTANSASLIEQQGTDTPTSSPSPDLIASLPAPEATSEISQFVQGAIILSLKEGEYNHLFYCFPSNCQLSRLTNGSWDDITPSVSPDGKYLAFSSNRNGHWDLYQMNLSTGEIIQLTATPEYDSHPSWSPDGRWMAYESYVPDPATNIPNLEIFIREITSANPQSQTPIRLTEHPGADYAPAWAPGGRQIAFVSTRDGEEGIWVANLDDSDNRFQKINHNQSATNDHPVWSPDGHYLAWASSIEGMQNIVICDLSHPEEPPRVIGGGSWAAWDAFGKSLAVILQSPNQSYLTGYQFEPSQLALPLINLNHSAQGITWLTVALPQPLPESLQKAAIITPTPSYQKSLGASVNIPGQRKTVVLLNGISAPYPQLNDAADEAFYALQSEVIRKTGWDFLATLENAFVPLTSPLYPGMLDDWLYTGRGFAFSTAPINAGWVVVVREDFGTQTYWRIFLRNRFQDGSQGSPLHHLTWDFDARNSGDPRAYEQGGALDNIPQGYWTDFTQIALEYGWERLPALSSWRLALPSARYNEYVLTDDLSWYSAMLEVYPAEAVVTQTPLPPPTLTPTITPKPTRTMTPTITLIPTETLTPTKMLTITRAPTLTRTPTVTSTSLFSDTPRPATSTEP